MGLPPPPETFPAPWRSISTLPAFEDEACGFDVVCDTASTEDVIGVVERIAEKIQQILLLSVNQDSKTQIRNHVHHFDSSCFHRSTVVPVGSYQVYNPNYCGNGGASDTCYLDHYQALVRLTFARDEWRFKQHR